MIQDVVSAVKQWRAEAELIGISLKEQERIAAVFRTAG